MKAITIFQPWASLVVVGAKPFEFRKWNPVEKGGALAELVGKEMVIHAAARRVDRREVLGLIDRLDRSARDRASTALLRDRAMPILQAALAMTMRDADGSLALPLSAGLGTATLGEPKLTAEIEEEFRLVKMNDSDRYDHAKWAWPMLDPEPWEQPIAMRGFQGFWNWPTPEALGL